MNTRPLPLIKPEPHGFLYLGFLADKPQTAPLYRQSPIRRLAASRLLSTAKDLGERANVLSARVFHTHIVPPLAGAPRHDLAMLIRTTTVESLADVRNDETVRSLGGAELLAGSNAARIGDTEADESAVFLFNHFTMTGDADPVGAWLTLTNWYTSRIGVDNSTALRPVDKESEFAFINYARLPTNPPTFLLNQLLRPSFQRIVRRTICARSQDFTG